jgi:cell division FtsZ-interacting protein ZapD
MVALRAKHRAAKLKTVFPSIEELLDRLIQQNFVKEELVREIESKKKKTTKTVKVTI